MNHTKPFLASLLLSVFAPLAVSASEVYYPVPGLVSQSTGLMESLVDGDWYRGSAVITRDPKLIYSCAHLFFERGRWASDYVFHRAYHGNSYPAGSAGASPRGFHYFTSYSSGVSRYGLDSDAAFASDFTVFYGNSDFGPAMGWWSKGGPALRSGRVKRIVGYPSDIDYTGQPGYCHQHMTGWFNNSAYQVYGTYHEFDSVSTGPGNSGGPVFVKNASGNEALAGILVSGTRRTAGAVGLDLSTDTMAGYALGLQDKTLVFSDTGAFRLPDGAKSDSIVEIPVSGFSGTLSKLKLSLSITTKRRSDLVVYLRAPNGKIRWIARHQGGDADHLILTEENLTKAFRGIDPNGKWQLHLRDSTAGVRAKFQNASLKVSAL